MPAMRKIDPSRGVSLPFFRFARRLIVGFSHSDDRTSAHDDPIDHPEIKKMSINEIADLPFPRDARPAGEVRP
jgi:hypothetical protein